MSKTQIKSKVVFYIESADKDLKHCGYYDNLEQCAKSIASTKIYSSKKFKNIDWDNEEEFKYFIRVEMRFGQLLTHWLDPNKGK